MVSPLFFPKLFLLLLLGHQNVQAWGKLGHQAVANVAWDLLHPETQQAIQDILNGSEAPYVHAVCAAPCSPLAFVADWADTARYSNAYHWSGPLHYVDIQDESLPEQCQQSNEGNWRPVCGFVPDRDCANQFCVAGSIANYTQQITATHHASSNVAMPNDDDDDDFAYAQKVALMFVTHFVGDIHQPLHVSRQSDRGGNTISVHVHNWTLPSSFHSMATTTSSLRGRGQAFDSSRRRGSATSRSHHHSLNLHAVWDDTMIDAFLETSKQSQPGSDTAPFATLHTLQSSKSEENRTTLELAMHKSIEAARKDGSTWAQWMACPNGQSTMCTTLWAQESWILAQERAYVNVDGEDIASGNILELEYYERNMPIVLEQLSMAAVRLAATLQVALSE